MYFCMQYWRVNQSINLHQICLKTSTGPVKWHKMDFFLNGSDNFDNNKVWVRNRLLTTWFKSQLSQNSCQIFIHKNMIKLLFYFITYLQALQTVGLLQYRPSKVMEKITIQRFQYEYLFWNPLSSKRVFTKCKLCL